MLSLFDHQAPKATTPQLVVAPDAPLARGANPGGASLERDRAALPASTVRAIEHCYMGLEYYPFRCTHCGARAWGWQGWRCEIIEPGGEVLAVDGVFCRSDCAEAEGQEQLDKMNERDGR